MSSEQDASSNVTDPSLSDKEAKFTRQLTENPLWQNPILAGLPNHLKQFVVDQQYDSYQPIDHAVWRFVMRQNYAFLKDHAHGAYVDGLSRTGIGIEQIPSVEEMNEILGKIGWACVTVDGFIPPAAFMEFQAFRVLVIAADIRQINHIEYTPAPDIIHEAAGHAPIIADPDYAEYLRRFGEIGAKAMSSAKDFELYEAIRHLSILKERPNADPKEIKEAEELVNYRQDNLGEPSEMARLSRLHWWTVEYGLVGTVDDPKIYGAGLLSSIGESTNCLKDSVKKIPYSLDAQEYAFDIVNQQPQLFVTPDFAHLTEVLERFADGMAFRVGGRLGLDKAIECRNVCTYEYSSGLQVSAVVEKYELDNDDEPILVRTSGPTMLAIGNQELGDNTRERYHDGLISPVGNLAGIGKQIESLTDDDLNRLGIRIGDQALITFQSGVKVSGKAQGFRRHGGRLYMVLLESARITYNGETMFDSDGKPFNLAVGEKIVSVFGGAADKEAFEQVSLVPNERTMKTGLTERETKLQALYARVRESRENGHYDNLEDIWKVLQADHSYDWLLAMELLELVSSNGNKTVLADQLRNFLIDKQNKQSELEDLIKRGLTLIN